MSHHPDGAPLILTLRLDDASQDVFEALRRRHFPPERNVIPAHLTLFHKLPPERTAAIIGELEALCERTAPLRLRAAGLRFLGRGVAIDIAGDGLVELRARLAGLWRADLSAQDAQGFKPHVTIQNKAAPAAAKALHAELAATFEPFAVAGEGLLLWRYLGGPWEPVRQVPFAGSDAG